jgi:hypothetical protein
MDDTDFGNFYNTDLASEFQDFSVQSNMPSPMEFQDVQAANNFLDSAATSPPAILTSLPNMSVPSASVSNVVSVAIAPTVTAVASVAPRVLCTVCGKTFGRRGELNRHTRKHNPNARQYACHQPGCTYSDVRMDKLQQHQANHGH